MCAIKMRTNSTVACSVLIMLSGAANGQATFSMDLESPTILQDPAFGSTDIYKPGPFGGSPVLVLNGKDVGLPHNWPFDRIGHSMGGVADVVYFSVDRHSQGSPKAMNDVIWQWKHGQQAGDIFTSNRNGMNRLVVNQADWGMLPMLRVDSTTSGPQDDLVSLDMAPGNLGLPTVGGADIVYNLDSVNGQGVSGADLLAPGVGVIVGYAELGLVAGDDIDAVHVDNGTVYFSLSWDSPTVQGFDLSGADIFISTRNGTFFTWAKAEALGLHELDEINALSFGGAFGPGCTPADLAEPFGLIDAADISAFVTLFLSGDFLADLNRNGMLDLSDVNLFVSSFLGGCP